MEKIIFSPENHIYYRESDGMQLMSVSHFRKLFDTTDWDHNVRKGAAQEYFKPTLYKKHKEEWEKKGRHILEPEFIDFLMPFMDKKTFLRLCKEKKAEWRATGDVAAAAGTEEHAIREDEAISSGFSVNPATGEVYPTKSHGKKPDGSNETTVECLLDLEKGFYPELILWYFFPTPIHSESLGRDICGIAGQTDKPYLGRSDAYVGDYKFTTKPLTDFGVKYNNFGKQMHTGPWADMPITKLSGYKIQLNTYGWMLQKHGYIVRDLRVHNTVLDTKQEQEFIIDFQPWRVEEAVDTVFMDSL